MSDNKPDDKTIFIRRGGQEKFFLDNLTKKHQYALVIGQIIETKLKSFNFNEVSPKDLREFMELQVKLEQEFVSGLDAHYNTNLYSAKDKRVVINFCDYSAKKLHKSIINQKVP